MRILRIHNRYQQRGGEDSVFEAECALLESYDHDVLRMEFNNDEIPHEIGLVKSLKLAANTVWSRSSHAAVAGAIDDFRPDVVHFDNTFPLVSPAAYSAGKRRGVAVVQTLHNYRLLCPSATLYLNGQIYEDNLGRLVPLRAVLDGAYRDSRAQTAVVGAMLSIHRILRTWNRNVDRYIALTEFSRNKFIQGGLDPSLIELKPNFVTAPPLSTGVSRSSFLFVGRLSAEKGVGTLLSSQSLHRQQLRVVGDGPMFGSVQSVCREESTLTALGRLTSSDVKLEMSGALALVFPSEWYEGFPVTLIESFAAGLPVIASRLGAMAEVVTDRETGLHFEPGNAEDLAAKISWASTHPAEMHRMGENARREFEAKYAPDLNHDLLIGIYERAIMRSRRSR